VRRAKPPIVPLDGPSATGPEPAGLPLPDPVEQDALARALEAAMAGVTPDQRSVLTLRYEEGLSFEEIGQILGMPEATARSHVHRARKELSRRLTEAGWGPSAGLQRATMDPRKP
jgi:DNA-directed RNA polymerase specialized sigma24 family protein